MITLGMVNLDTSHTVAFAQRLHHQGIGEEQWVDGARVTHAWRGESNVCTPEQMDGYQAKLVDEFGVTMVDSLDEMVPLVEAVCIEANEGWRHLELARPFLLAGKRCWIDKPFAGDFAQARAMVDLAAEHGAAVMSCSSLRFADELVEFAAAHPAVTGVDVICPAPQHEHNPGLLHYGIHGVEMLFALLGAGCAEVSCTWREDQQLCVGRWRDGRVGTLRGLHAGPAPYAFRAVADGAHDVAVGTGSIYRNLLRHMVRFFETGEAPYPIAETLEISAFMDAAMASAEHDGAFVALPE